MSPSDIRMILAALSERAAADSRKCWAMPTAAEHPTSFLPEARPRYKPDFAGGGCYMMPEILLLAGVNFGRRLGVKLRRRSTGWYPSAHSRLARVIPGGPGSILDADWG